MPRIALIYDCETRPDTTGVYVDRALQRIANVRTFSPRETASISANDFDLVLNVDDGLRYELPSGLCPSVFWAIDTHMDFDWALKKARGFDFVFAAQKDDAARLRQNGVDAVEWLPLAADPETHRKHDVDKRYDICFVGNLVSQVRERLVRLVQRQFPNSFVGNRYFEEMSQTYSASRIVFNRSVKNDLNMRVFEALSCGSLLITNDLDGNGLHDLFEPDVHLVTYSDAGQLIDKIRFYLAHEEQRERIAEAGRLEVLERHTYQHRMRVILERVAGACQCGGPRHRVRTPERKRDPFYFDCARPEVLALIPESATSVLDIGCGAGRLGQSIKKRQRARVVGIEIDEQAARSAEAVLDEVVLGDVEALPLEFRAGSFDCIVCADLLEHLHDPEALLYRTRNWMSDNGTLVASVPNVRHHSVVSGLLDGNWTYEVAGLLDTTHLHFFTRRDIESLLQKAGFAIETIEFVPGPGYEEWQHQGRPGSVRIGRLSLCGLPEREAEEYFVYQYVFRASRTDVHRTRTQTPTLVANGDLPPPSRAGSVASADIAHLGVVDGLRQTPRDHSVPQPHRMLSLLYVGDFESPGRSEQYAAAGLKALGHRVVTVHDASVASADALLHVLETGGFDCFLFYKGCLGARTTHDRLHPSGEAIANVLRATSIPGYLWYFDRVYEYDFDPTREAWMRNVAPLCRVAFVTDAALAKTDFAHWYVLRQGVCRSTVERVLVPDKDRIDVGFIGQVYGERQAQLARVRGQYRVNVIEGTFGRDLNRVVRGHKIILGPQFPSTPGYWSNRLYVVLGHGGFFLAPEVEGMREEGFLPGIHYATFGDDPLRDIEYWLNWPAERERIARAGQELVLSQYTYEHRVAQMVRVIEATL